MKLILTMTPEEIAAWELAMQEGKPPPQAPLRRIVTVPITRREVK